MEESEIPSRCDIAIIGGGVVGSSVAYFAQQLAADASVCVVEPDPTYEFASTPRASGGCRVQFSRPENIDMSLYSLQFIRDFARDMSTPNHSADVGWIEGGYLFIVPPEHVKMLEANVRAQRERGCEVELLTPSELKAKFPSINSDDLGQARTRRTTDGAIRTVCCGVFAARHNRSASPISKIASSARTSRAMK